MFRLGHLALDSVVNIKIQLDWVCLVGKQRFCYILLSMVELVRGEFAVVFVVYVD